MSEMFSIDTQLPDHQPEVPLFRTARSHTFSRRDEKLMREVRRRYDRYARHFGIDGEVGDLGDTLTYLDENVALEVYLPSDSAWWTDRRLAYSEKRGAGRGLPDPEKAKSMADGLIEELGESHDALRFNAVDYMRTALSTSPEERPRSYRTGLVVDYRFELAELPVFGPGAKVQVSLAGKGEISEFLVFWRRPRRERRVKVIHPYHALERFAQDDRLADLSPDRAKFSVTEFRLGYFAANPSAFQRFLIPVYSVQARVATEVHPEHDVRVYVTATDFGGTELKRLGVLARPQGGSVFSGA